MATLTSTDRQTDRKGRDENGKRNQNFFPLSPLFLLQSSKACLIPFERSLLVAAGRQAASYLEATRDLQVAVRVATRSQSLYVGSCFSMYFTKLLATLLDCTTDF